MHLAERVKYINEPQTIAMAKLGRELAAQGHDIISLSLGEPDFPTPLHIKEAAKNAIDENFSYYTPVAGIPELREAIVKKFKRDNNLDFATENILVSTGAKHSIMNAIMALVNKGDEVLIPTPYWVSYSEMVKLMEGIPAFIHASIEQQYKITPYQLKQAITAKTRLFIFSSPCNPTGSVYSKAELSELVTVFENYPDIYIISDEIYEYINFVGKHESIAQFESIKNRVVTINGLSKGYAMTGWRLGYMAASPEIIKACENIQSQYTSATSSITQKAAVAALTHNNEPSQQMVSSFRRRRELIFSAAKEITGWKCNQPDGAFYLFPDISYYFGKKYDDTVIRNASDFSMYLLHKAHVSTVTGDAFGAPNCIRISYAAADEKISDAMKRIHKACGELI